MSQDSSLTQSGQSVRQALTAYTAKAKSSEPPNNGTAMNDVPNNNMPNSEPHQTTAVQLKPGRQREANAAALTPSDDTVSVPPTMPVESFNSRWSGLQKSETSVEFKYRWALDSP